MDPNSAPARCYPVEQGGCSPFIVTMPTLAYLTVIADTYRPTINVVCAVTYSNNAENLEALLYVICTSL